MKKAIICYNIECQYSLTNKLFRVEFRRCSLLISRRAPRVGLVRWASKLILQLLQSHDDALVALADLALAGGVGVAAHDLKSVIVFYRSPNKLRREI